MRRLRQGSPGARGEAPPTRRAPRAAPCTFRSPRPRTRRGRRRWRNSSRARDWRRACCSPRAPMTATGSYWVRTRPGPRRRRSAGSSGAPSGSTSPARRDAPPAAALAARRLGAVARRGAGAGGAGARHGRPEVGGRRGVGRRARRRSDGGPPRGARGPVVRGPEAARGGGPLPPLGRHRGRLRVRRVAHEGGPRDRPRLLHSCGDRDVARRGPVRESTLAAAARRLPRGGGAAVAVLVGGRVGAALRRSRRAARAVTRRLRAGVVDRPGHQRGDGARHPVAGRGAGALDAGGDAGAGRAAVARLGGPCGAGGAAAVGAPRGRGGHARGRRRRRLGTVRARRRTACRDARPACRAAGPARSPPPARPPPVTPAPRRDSLPWTVQLAAYGRLDKALAVGDRLAAGGIPPFVTPVALSGRRGGAIAWDSGRLIVGAFESPEQAALTEARLKRAGIPATLVTRMGTTP